jgi:hypothetical protein
MHLELPMNFLARTVLAACAVLACACHNPSSSDAGQPSRVVPLGASGPAPIVTGTVLDARTGKPLAGALVRGPDGVEAKSDAQGRFVLRGLRLGASGELVGTSESGLSGKNRLRALEGGPLEVVLHLR